MNDIPVINMLPEKYRGWAILLVAVFPYLTRAFYAIVQGGGIVGIFRAIFWGSNTPKLIAQPDGTVTPHAPKGTAGYLGLVLAFGLAIWALATFATGCASGTSRLEFGGAYAPTVPSYQTNAAGIVSTNQVQVIESDFALFAADSSFAIADSGFRTVSNIEIKNRELLWKLDPNIKLQLDKMRIEAWKVVGDYTKAREAYKLYPTPAGLSTMQSALSKLQALTAAAVTVIPQTQK
jgi:hypothetical protein